MSDAKKNMRINGTGRFYVADVGSHRVGREIGEIDGLSDTFATTSEDYTSNRTAARSVIVSANSKIEASLAFGMREMSIDNMELACSAEPHTTTSQAKGTFDAEQFAMVEGEFIDVGKLDCVVTKLGHGAVVGGPFVVGENVTGGVSAATGQVAWVDSGFVELIDVSGTFSSGEALTGSTSAATAPSSSIEVLADFVICDAADPATRYELGVDYKVDGDYGYIEKLAGGSIGDTAFISCDYPLVEVKKIHALSGGAVEKKLTFVSDADDLGPRLRYIYHRVKMMLNGDSQKIGDGEAIHSMTGTILADTSKPTGQQYFSVEKIG